MGGKAKYAKPDVNIDEYDILYLTGDKQYTWSVDIPIDDEDVNAATQKKLHYPLTCVLEEVSPTCDQLGSTTGRTDMQTHFEIVADEADPDTGLNTKCILTLSSNIDYENQLISHNDNIDRSI